MTVEGLLRRLHKQTETKIVLVVADGLGGLPIVDGGKTELEAAHTPHLDKMARRGVTGLMHPVLPGVTCGSGPGHLALFGYDPLTYEIGRGVLAALGINVGIEGNDIAARGNFCTVDVDGKVTDRRAGRISDHEGRRLVDKLRRIDLKGVEVFVEPVQQYRFCAIFRGKGLGDKVNDSDPQTTGVAPVAMKGGDPESEKTAQAAAQFVHQASEILRDERPANMMLLRGFSRRPDIPPMSEIYGLAPCAIAVYPMYRGLSRLLGMQVVECGKELHDEVDALLEKWGHHDFFYLHFKDTDSTAEDGDFDRKVGAIERLDSQMPRILERKPDVLIVTGDHSTPSALRSHSWHPVPVVLIANSCRPDYVTTFGERAAVSGGLGQFEAKHLMALALAHAGKLEKFGA